MKTSSCFEYESQVCISIGFVIFFSIMDLHCIHLSKYYSTFFNIANSAIQLDFILLNFCNFLYIYFRYIFSN